MDREPPQAVTANPLLDDDGPRLPRRWLPWAWRLLVLSALMVPVWAWHDPLPPSATPTRHQVTEQYSFEVVQTVHTRDLLLVLSRAVDRGLSRGWDAGRGVIDLLSINQGDREVPADVTLQDGRGQLMEVGVGEVVPAHTGQRRVIEITPASRVEGVRIKERFPDEGE